MQTSICTFIKDEQTKEIASHVELKTVHDFCLNFFSLICFVSYYSYEVFLILSVWRMSSMPFIPEPVAVCSEGSANSTSDIASLFKEHHKHAPLGFLLQKLQLDIPGAYDLSGRQRYLEK